MEIEVKGHSGCQIDVINEDGQIYVYKSTADPKYLQRLALQAHKQQAAAGVEYQHIRVPKIFEIIETGLNGSNSLNGSKSTSQTPQTSRPQVVIKMQYVYSKNFIEFFEQAGFEQVDYLIEALKTFVEYEISKCELQKVSPKIFQEKFAEIRSKVENNPLYFEKGEERKEKGILNSENTPSPSTLTPSPSALLPSPFSLNPSPSIASIIDRSQKVFDALGELTIPVGICHGDLTFSNILFNGNNYYLIDFLDSFIETPLQDIVKIRQDTQFRWSQLMYSKPYDATRLRIVCDKIDNEIHQYFTRKYQWYSDNYPVMQLMNILRILPYAKEQKVVQYLVEVLNQLLDSIEKGEERKEKGILASETTPSPSPLLPQPFSFNPSPSERSLIMPIAADKPEYKSRIPKVFMVAEDGIMLCIRALKSLDFNKFDHIYITILRHLDQQYALTERLLLQFRINGITNAEIVVLDEPTRSQPETIYQTIIQKHIQGSIFIKDADCSFTGEDTADNAIAIHPLEQLDWVNPKNKSYVSVDDMYYITNIIEKRIVSHYFTAGGYSFESAANYCQYYERLQQQPGLYLSHIIYAMLLEGHTFRPILTKEYEDFEFKNYNK